MKAAPVECKQLLTKGAFSIRRTNKNFARSAVDITLEQTVNRKAASPSQGLVHFHNSKDAIRRWCISSNQRQMIVTQGDSLVNMQKMEKPYTQNTNYYISN